MATQLETDLKFLLPFKIDSEEIDVDKVLTDKRLSIKLFYEEFYSRPEKNWKLNDCTLEGISGYSKQIIDWNITDIKPFHEEFTVEKFWFKNTGLEDTPYKNLKAEEGSIIGFKDGINTIFYQGDYLDGGEIYSKKAKTSVVSTSVNNNLDDNKKKSNPSSSNYSKFIYAYFPPKLYLSPNNKNYFVLTQGKHLLRNREQAVIRFYFNLKPDKIDTTNVKAFEDSIENFKSEVKSFINLIEKYLDNHRIPFQFKLPVSLENFQRADTFVLYVSQNHYYYLYEFIKLHSDNFKHIFSENLPLFVSPFADVKGVGIAEDPDIAGDSFGYNRCRLIYNIISELSKKSNTNIIINDIIDELKIQGYREDEFFKKPNTNFDYSFNQYNDIDLITVLGSTYPQNTRYYLYIYGKVALNYALDLVERAIWIDSREITWITYYEEDIEGNKEKGYRLIDEGESEQIFWFLYQVLKFKWMRDFFPKNLISIILDRFPKLEEANPNYLDKISENFKKTKKKYSELTKEIDFQLKSKENWFDKVKLGIDKLTFGLTGMIEKSEQYWETILSTPGGDTLSTIYGVNKSEFNKNKDLIKNARKIYYEFLKPLYPLESKDGNYEYYPTNKGKLQIAMIMLFVYCPSLFPKNAEEQVSSL